MPGARHPPGRPTTVKTRVIARHQQVLRVDVEDESPVAAPSAGEVCSRALAALPEADALVISDYAKGVVDRALLGQVLGEARRAGLPAIVDPKSSELSRYAPASVITPNEGELARAAGRALHDLAEIEGAARELIAEGVDAFVVTLGERGMLVVPAGKAAESIPARAREVFDVTGAGDTVTASLALALSAGLSLGEAARIGNAAAAVAVSRVGTSAVSWQEVSALEAPT